MGSRCRLPKKQKHNRNVENKKKTSKSEINQFIPSMVLFFARLVMVGLHAHTFPNGKWQLFDGGNLRTVAPTENMKKKHHNFNLTYKNTPYEHENIMYIASYTKKK
jgi:hypothetical protein